MTWTVPPSTRPGGAADVGGALGAEEDDRGGDLGGVGEAADRALGAGGLERLGAARGAGHRLGLVEQAAGRHPHLRFGRAGADRVDEHAAGRVAVGEEARERELRRLRHRVLRHRRRWALAGRRADVDDPAPATLGHRRGDGTHRPQRRHHVDLVLRPPVLVGDIVEVAPAGVAGVVDEHVEGAEALRRGGQDPLTGVVGGDVEGEDRGLAARLPTRRRRPLPGPPAGAPRRGRRGARWRPRHRAGSRSRGRCRGWRR